MNQKAKELLNKEKYVFSDLCTVMEILRGEDGCPWDREQDHKSIRGNFIEETYEVIEAIDNDDTELLREELGDVMLQVVFHARMEEEAGRFSIDDVSNDICKKLIVRHPHIFADVEADTSEQVLKNWEQIKNKEKARKTTTQSLLSIPPSLPSLMRADKAGSKAAKVGFDFVDGAEALLKIEEETVELKSAIKNNDTQNIEEEFGDLLFSVVNCARKLGVDSEKALGSAVNKFIDRFAAMEKVVTESGKNVADMSMKELDEVWEIIKKHKNC